MKIFAAGIITETDTFSSVPTGLIDFTVQRGKDASEGGARYPGLDLSEVWGRHARATGAEFVFSLMAFAQPAGLTVRAAYESLRAEILSDLASAMPVDVVLLMLHGAMVAEGHEDCEEDLIQRVRAVVGPDAVIGVELDLHCHLTPAKIAAADVVITYKEYPHVDINDRAREVFDLAVNTRRGQIRPTMALFDCRMIGLYPTTRQPLRALVDSMKEAERREGILSISFGHGYQFADLPQVGAKILVVTDNDRALAARVAREFGLRAYELRREIGFESISLPMETALLKALASPARPVVVADQSDNVGAGAPGDATFALGWLLDHQVQNAATAIIYDPEVAKIAHRAGQGAKVDVRLGGKLGRSSGAPLDITVEVLSTLTQHSHIFPQDSGQPLSFPVGDVAALRCDGIDIVVGSVRCQCYAPSIFVDLGIDPASKDLLVPKSTQHFQGPFSVIAKEVIYMAAPGACNPDPRQIPYRRLDTSEMYPWNQDPLVR